MKKPYYVVPRSAADVDNLDAVSALFALNDVMEETARDAVGRIMQELEIYQKELIGFINNPGTYTPEAQAGVRKALKIYVARRAAAATEAARAIGAALGI
eukprot:CAMPEP_0119474964 /NCGR_PEP_ID=MMETSP1344-20130328/6022_1 /TAXON_ID=236787 /ORGANISM="Florenciella parvula, Strain CCMP2471" /LENGTH=99 /DNA_ID=CAMNT_0007508363 /DNA_START=184 /DNA_END=483 /DNA_ORIENTATION=+